MKSAYVIGNWNVVKKTRKGIKFLKQWHYVDKITRRELWEEVVEAKATNPKERIEES